MANEYVTSAALKATLQITGTASDTDISNACSAASLAIEEEAGRRFWKDATDTTRVYTAYSQNRGYGYPYRYGFTESILDIDDVASFTSLKVDVDGDGTYETTWTNGVDFFLDPPNASNDSKPYERVVLLAAAGRTFPAWDNAIQIVAKFGWPAVPAQVTEYAGILAAQLYLRSRQAPFGVIMAGMEIGSSARISRYDPDFDRLLGKLCKPAQLIA